MTEKKHKPLPEGPSPEEIVVAQEERFQKEYQTIKDTKPFQEQGLVASMMVAGLNLFSALSLVFNDAVPIQSKEQAIATLMVGFARNVEIVGKRAQEMDAEIRHSLRKKRIL